MLTGVKKGGLAGARLKSWVFVALTSVAIGLCVVYVGYKKDLFTPRGTLYFVADDGYEISAGQPVMLSGFVIGKVDEMALDDVAHVRVTLSIYTRYMKWIKVDSKAKLAKPGMIGDAFIAITPGRPDSITVESGDMLMFERDKGINELVAEMKDELGNMLHQVSEVIRYANDPNGEIKTAIRNVERATADISSMTARFDSLSEKIVGQTEGKFEDADQIIGNLKDASSSLKTVVSDTGDMVKTTDGNLKSTFEKLNVSLERLQKTTENLRVGSEKVPPLVDKGRETLEGAGEVVDSTKKVWPVRLYVNQPEEGTVEVDSYE